jgi:hypothetical protein
MLLFQLLSCKETGTVRLCARVTVDRLDSIAGSPNAS